MKLGQEKLCFDGCADGSLLNLMFAMFLTDCVMAISLQSLEQISVFFLCQMSVVLPKNVQMYSKKEETFSS